MFLNQLWKFLSIHKGFRVNRSWCCGNSFLKPLSRNGYTHYNIFATCFNIIVKIINKLKTWRYSKPKLLRERNIKIMKAATIEQRNSMTWQIRASEPSFLLPHCALCVDKRIRTQNISAVFKKRCSNEETYFAVKSTRNMLKSTTISWHLRN